MSYIVIPSEYNGKGLKPNEKMLLALIGGFCQEQQGIFYGSIQYICDFLECTKKTAIESLKKLCERGLLEKGELMVDGVRRCTYKLAGGGVIFTPGGVISTPSSLPSSSSSFPPHPPINNNTNLPNTQDKKENSFGVKKDNRFVPPTLEDVKTLVKSKNYKVDPLDFWTYYEAQGWKLSNGVRMKNWKAALVRWELRSIKEHGDR